MEWNVSEVQKVNIKYTEIIAVRSVIPADALFGRVELFLLTYFKKERKL